MPVNLENSTVATDLENSIFIPIPKKGNAKECSNYHTIALISHTSKVMLKMLQARLQQYMNPQLPDVQAEFRILPSVGSLKKQENSRKTSNYTLLTKRGYMYTYS